MDELNRLLNSLITEATTIGKMEQTGVEPSAKMLNTIRQDIINLFVQTRDSRVSPKN